MCWAPGQRTVLCGFSSPTFSCSALLLTSTKEMQKMASQVNLQPLITYVWPISKKGPMDAYQRRPWAKNNWTKTWEEKKNRKTPNLGKHICYELSILVDEHKRKNRLPKSHCMKKWPQTHVTKKSRLPDSKLMTVIVGWSSTGSRSVPDIVPGTLSYWFWNSPVK